MASPEAIKRFGEVEEVPSFGNAQMGSVEKWNIPVIGYKSLKKQL
jgi:hypothetical protein